LPESTLDVLRGVPLTEEQAREISARGEEAVVFVLLELSKRLAEQKGKTAAGSHQTAGTPSGMKPPYRKPPGRHWPAFAKKLRRLLGDAIRLWRRREQLPKTTYASRRRRLEIRLQQLIDTPWNDAHAKRLVKRLRRHRNDLFTFLDQPGVPFDNNAAELPHPQRARPRPDPNRGRRPSHLPHHRTTPSTPRASANFRDIRQLPNRPRLS